MIAVTVPEAGFVLICRRGIIPSILKVNEELDSLLWERTLEDQDARLYEITLSHDGSGYVAAGAVDGFSKACIIGFDLEGNTIWTSIFAYSDTTESHVRSIAALPDGYLVAGSIGYAETSEADGDDVYLVKTNLQGEIVHDTAYGHQGFTEQSNDVDATPNGDCYVVGVSTDNSIYEPNFYVVRTDPNGLQR